MLPVARSALRRIGDGTDVVTYVSRYTRGRFASAFGAACRAGTPAAGGGHRPVRPGSGRPRGDAGAVRARRATSHRLPVPAGAPQGPGHADPGIACHPRARRRRRPGHRGRRPLPGDAAPARAAGRRHRARGLHRRCARRRTARPPRDGRRVRDAVPHPRRRPGRRGPRHRLPGSVGDRCAGGRRPVGRGARDRARRRHRTRRERLGRRRNRHCRRRNTRRSGAGGPDGRGRAPLGRHQLAVAPRRRDWPGC